MILYSIFSIYFIFIKKANIYLCLLYNQHIYLLCFFLNKIQLMEQLIYPLHYKVQMDLQRIQHPKFL